LKIEKGIQEVEKITNMEEKVSNCPKQANIGRTLKDLNLIDNIN
jgi:hypothetical protein